MPYIKEHRRISLSGCLAEDAGELNYQITRLILEYFRSRGSSYQTINDIVGALEGAKLEFYARVVRPYENQKIQENGDVY